MPRILVTCPSSGAIVPTGHRTAEIDLATMTGSRSFRCPTCQKVHDWTADVAVAEEMAQRSPSPYVI
jgi:hypothetical protein